MDSLKQEQITVTITYPFWKVYRAALQIIIRSRIQLIISMIFPIAGLFLVYGWFKLNHTMSLYDTGILFLCFFFTPIIVASMLLLTRRRNPLAKGPFIFSFDDEGIHSSGEAFTSLIKWTAIQKVVETGSFIHFYLSPSQTLSFPIDQLQAADCLDALRILAVKKSSNAVKN